MRYSPLIIITNRTCNNTCVHCSTKNTISKGYEEISIKEFSGIVNDFDFVDEIYLFGGEPSIAKHFMDFIFIINDTGHKIGIVTNGRIFEKKETSDMFRQKINERGIREIAIILSIDNFHKKGYVQRMGKVEKYPLDILRNIGQASSNNVLVNLEINRVYSKDRKHNPTKCQYDKIMNMCSWMKKRGKIKNFRFVLDPLQEKEGTQIQRLCKEKSLYIEKEPILHPESFNYCSPYFVAMKKENKIEYSFCMYLGEKSVFSQHGSNVKGDLNLFLHKHNQLKKIIIKKNDVYKEFIKIGRNDGFKDYLQSKQKCYKENRACSICKYLFNNDMI